MQAQSGGLRLPEIKTGSGVLRCQKLAACLIRQAEDQRKVAREGIGFTQVYWPEPGDDLRHCAGSTQAGWLLMVLHAELLQSARRHRRSIGHLVVAGLLYAGFRYTPGASPMRAETGMSNSDNALSLRRARLGPDGRNQF